MLAYAVPINMNPVREWRLLDTFDWYSPKFQWKHTPDEVAEWFEREGLVDISTEGYAVTVRGRRPAVDKAARKPAIETAQVTSPR